MNSALLVIDVQNAFFRPSAPPLEADVVLDRINTLAERARARKIPVLFVQHECPEDGLPYGTDDWQLVPRLVIETGDLRIRKTTTDSFLETPLQAHLDQAKITHLVVCGYASEFCIDTTVRRAAALGFHVTLVSNAHTTDERTHLRALQIREHHNITLADVTSFRGEIRAMPMEAVWTSSKG